MLQVSQDVEDTSPLSAPHLWNPMADVALATLNGVFVPEFYLKPGQQPVSIAIKTSPCERTNTTTQTGAMSVMQMTPCCARG